MSLDKVWINDRVAAPCGNLDFDADFFELDEENRIRLKIQNREAMKNSGLMYNIQVRITGIPDKDGNIVAVRKFLVGIPA